MRIARGASRPTGEMVKLKPVRIGLWDQYGGSMPSGWTRWLLEQFEFPFEVVYPQTLDAGNLNAKFDVLVFVDGAIPATGRPPAVAAASSARRSIRRRFPSSSAAGWARVTADKTVPQLKAFLENGGTILDHWQLDATSPIT